MQTCSEGKAKKMKQADSHKKEAEASRQLQLTKNLRPDKLLQNAHAEFWSKTKCKISKKCDATGKETTCKHAFWVDPAL